MNRNKPTTTEKNAKSITCSFKGCPTKANSYSNYKAGEEWFCSVHMSPDYQEHYKEDKELEARALGADDSILSGIWGSPENPVSFQNIKDKFPDYKKKKNSLKGKSFLKVGFNLGINRIFEEYQVQEANGTRFIVGIEGHTYSTFSIHKEPELFLKFADLPDEESAYVSFILTYGLLGVNGAVTSEESLESIRAFQLDFKEALRWAKASIENEHYSHYESYLEQWLFRYFNSLINIKPTTSGEIVFYHWTLAGALVLQLYRFLLLGQSVKICELPGCNAQTTRKKFCSERHQKLYNAWKLRGKLEGKEEQCSAFHKVDLKKDDSLESFKLAADTAKQWQKNIEQRKEEK